MDKDCGQFLDLFTRCELAECLCANDWDLVVRQGRSAGMLARLYFQLQQRLCKASIPPRVINHLESAALVADRHAETVRYEVEQIARVLTELDAPVVLLKGAAYVLADLPPAKGRLFSDIDVLLPKELLPRAEYLLKYKGGWLSAHMNDYDQRYYRKWMHELPPLRHRYRHTELDVHHAIVPKTARVSPDVKKLLESKVAIDADRNLYRLGNEDLILHSAVHLFHDGEFTHGLRDLEDINSLLECFCGQEADWNRLIQRAQELGLQRPLYYALYYCKKLLMAPIPEVVFKRAEAQCARSGVSKWLMQQLFARGLMPDHPSCRDRWTGMALWSLYIRSHYLRMPFHLLLPHLFHKAIISPLSARKQAKLAERRMTLEKLLQAGK